MRDHTWLGESAEQWTDLLTYFSSKSLVFLCFVYLFIQPFFIYQQCYRMYSFDAIITICWIS